MKLMVEFESKAEMDEFFAASEAGAIEPVASVYILNQTGQSFGLRMTEAQDEPGAAVVEIHQRGTDECEMLAPGAVLKIL